MEIGQLFFHIYMYIFGRVKHFSKRFYFAFCFCYGSNQNEKKIKIKRFMFLHAYQR